MARVANNHRGNGSAVFVVVIPWLADVRAKGGWLVEIGLEKVFTNDRELYCHPHTTL